MAKPVIRCPQCGMDVMETGFCTEAAITKSYLPMGGKPTLIATAQHEPSKALCFQCHAELPGVNPCELMRMA